MICCPMCGRKMELLEIPAEGSAFDDEKIRYYVSHHCEDDLKWGGRGCDFYGPIRSTREAAINAAAMKLRVFLVRALESTESDGS